jgi:hypothetical protein
MVDGDGTYDATAAKRLLETLASGPYDMVNVARKHVDQAAYRPGHVFGNQMLTELVGFFFGTKTTDMLSGYKAFDLAPKFYPVLSSLGPLDLPGWAVGATGAGAEPSA